MTETAENAGSGQNAPEERGFRFAGDDAVIPFAVEALNVRGRIIQMGAELDKLISRHNYPEPVASLLAQGAALAALIGSALKFEGRYSIQTQTDGAVGALVCDYRTPAKEGEPGMMRAYARFDERKLAAMAPAERSSQAALMGKGTIAFTIDEKPAGQLYQGAVPLSGDMDLERAAMEYFTRSEQIPTHIRLSSALLSTRQSDGTLKKEWRAGGIMAQYLPISGEAARKRAELAAQTGFELPSGGDKWREAAVLTATAEDIELTDPQLPAERLLYRLFHEQGVRVYSPQQVTEKCSCSREKLHNLIAGFSEQERRDSIEDGKISAQCRFCSREYEFSPDEFEPEQREAVGKEAAA